METGVHSLLTMSFPAPSPDWPPITPTHLVSSQPDLTAALNSLLCNQKSLYAIRIDPSEFLYKVAWEQEDLMVRLIGREVGGRGEGSDFLCEILKYAGCTLTFCSWYKVFLSHVKHDPSIDHAALADDSKKHIRDWEQRDDLTEMSRGIVLENLHPSELAETLLPVQSMLISVWSQSVLEGCKLAATITNHTDNARVLAGFHPFIKALSNEHMHKHLGSPHLTRCLARTLANIMSWRTIIPEELKGDLGNLIAKIKEAVVLSPMWAHASKEIERLTL